MPLSNDKTIPVTPSERDTPPNDLLVELKTAHEIYDELKNEMTTKESTDTLESINRIFVDFADHVVTLKKLHMQNGDDNLGTLETEHNTFLVKWLIDLVAACINKDEEGKKIITWIVEQLLEQDKPFYLQDDINTLFNDIVTFCIKKNDTELALYARNCQINCLFFNTKKDGTIHRSVLPSIDKIHSAHLKDYPQHSSQIYLNIADRLIENVASLKLTKKLNQYVNNQFFLIKYFINEAIENAEDKNSTLELIIESLKQYRVNNLSYLQKKELEKLATECKSRIFIPVNFIPLNMLGKLDSKQSVGEQKIIPNNNSRNTNENNPPLKRLRKKSIDIMPTIAESPTILKPQATKRKFEGRVDREVSSINQPDCAPSVTPAPSPKESTETLLVKPNLYIAISSSTTTPDEPTNKRLKTMLPEKKSPTLSLTVESKTESKAAEQPIPTSSVKVETTVQPLVQTKVITPQITIPTLTAPRISEAKQPAISPPIRQQSATLSPKPLIQNPSRATSIGETENIRQLEQRRKWQAQQLQFFQSQQRARQQALMLQQQKIWLMNQNAQKLQQFINETQRQLLILKDKKELHQLENRFRLLAIQLQHYPRWVNQIINILKAIDGQLLLITPEQITVKTTKCLASANGMYSSSLKTANEKPVDLPPPLHAKTSSDKRLSGP